VKPETVADLERELAARNLTMSATATGGLWTVVLDGPNESHALGSGSSLYAAIRHAFGTYDAKYTEARTLTVKDEWGHDRVVGGFGDVGSGLCNQRNTPDRVGLCPAHGDVPCPKKP